MDEQPSASAVDHAIRSYRDLLFDLVTGSLSAEDFEPEYLRRYLASDDLNPPAVFDVIDEFFADVDAYVSDPGLVDRADGDLDAEELRNRALQLLRRAGHELAVPIARAG